MQFFKDTILELSAVQELQKYLNRGVSPISFSGVSHIHKAQLLAALACDTPGLVVTEDDASARRLCDDINLMLGENRAIVKAGLRILAQGGRAGVDALMEESGMVRSSSGFSGAGNP